MLKAFYRYLYHRRQQRASRQRLSGRQRPSARWHRFSYNVFQRTERTRDKPKTRQRLLLWGLGPPAVLLLLWFFWQSISAIGIFQP